MSETIPLSGLTCGACVARVTAALQPLDPAVRVSLTEARFSGAPDRAAVARALDAAGDYAIGESDAAPAPSWTAYQPLIVIVALLALASFADAVHGGTVHWHAWMAHFMGGFFLVFGGFKLFDLSGFADAYATYDLLAARSRAYGLSYPFLEIGLGFAYLFGLWPVATLIATIALMGFSSLGVIKALTSGRRIQCACLGTSLKLPMSTVTLIEDLGMAAMAALMLAFAH